VSESSNSSQFDDITSDFDDQESENDDMSCPAEQETNEEGKESNGGGLVPQLVVERTDREVDDSVQIVVRKDRRTQKKILEDSEFVKFVVDSIINVDVHDKLTPPEEKKE
ncbi:hypothetical protein HAX54_045608, partial [Datura stramonium]|nr:hypothetical protein [Datura stramonium]